MKITKRTTVLLLLLLAVALISFGCAEDEKNNNTVSPTAKATVAPNESTGEPTQNPNADSTAEKTDEQSSDANEKATDELKPSATSEATKDSTVESTKTPIKTPTKAPVKTPVKTAATKTPAQKTPTKTAAKTPNKTPAKATAKPTSGASNKITYEQLVSNLMKEAQNVADFIKTQGFVYGDAALNPPMNWVGLDKSSAVNPGEKKVSCDRLVGWILYRVGFTDQPSTQGLTVYMFPSWCEQQGFTKITNVSQLKAGDIVFVNPDAQGRAAHVFMCASSNLGNNVYDRYDAGSDDRIQCKKGTEVTPGRQPFRETIMNFMYAYRPTTNKLNLASVSEKPSSTVAVPKSNATQVFTAADKTWSKSATAYPLNYRYEPGNGYNQYELHMKLSSKPSSTDTNYWNACYIGVRMPTTELLPFTGKGGIWVAFNDNRASVYFGATTDWNIRLTGVTLPVSVSSAKNIIVVDSGDYIKYYISTSSNSKTLFMTMKVDSSDGSVIIWNSNNDLIYTGVATINSWGYFSTANHHADSVVSNIKVYGAN